MSSKLIGILGLALLMVLHEGGHYLAARAFGMRVTKFSIGFGPTLLKILPKDGYFWLTVAADRFQVRLFKHDPVRHGPTIYQVAIIPFLAYVQIAGMNPMDEVDENDKGSYANASLIGRIITIFSGPFANYAFASVFFFLSFFFGGKVELNTAVTLVDVLPDRAAAAAHMIDGDRIVDVAGTPVADWKQMAEAISQHPDQTIPIIVERKGERLTLTVKPINEDGKGKIGVQATKKHIKLDAKESLILAATTPAMVVKDSVVGLKDLILRKAKGDIMGPVGIVKETAKAAESSWTDFCYILAFISAYLGAFNLIPFPALDGGRLVFLTYEATTRKRPNARVEAHIHAIGLVMMISLTLWATVAKDFGLGSK